MFLVVLCTSLVLAIEFPVTSMVCTTNVMDTSQSSPPWRDSKFLTTCADDGPLVCKKVSGHCILHMGLGTAKRMKNIESCKEMMGWCNMLEMEGQNPSESGGLTSTDLGIQWAMSWPLILKSVWICEGKPETWMASKSKSRAGH